MCAPFLLAGSFITSCLAASLNLHGSVDNPTGEDLTSAWIYLPAVYKSAPQRPIINVSYFEGPEVNYHQAAVFWFGQVRDNENYADVRVGYNDNMVYIRVAVIDRYLWYDTDPTVDDLASWDAITLYLDIDGRDRQIPDSSTYRFVGQLNWWEGRDNYQASYQGSPSGWNIVPLTFFTYSGWRGNAPNDATEDRGWVLNYHIPFSSLGLSGAPMTEINWRIGFTLHDRDNPTVATRANKYWPENFDHQSIVTWGQLSFGMPTYTPPQASTTQTVIIRNGLNGTAVLDGVVGGNTLCGQGLNFWDQWGDHS